MADEFVQLVPLENGETEELGQHLNDSLEALEVAANLALRYRRDVNDGEWDGAIAYKLSDVVFWADSYWHALAANVMSEPDSENANWRKIGGGDSGGGHEIFDSEGDGLTQRAGLQFEGDDVSLSDDAAGNKTKVSIARKIAVFLAGVAKGVQGKLNFIAGDNVSIAAEEDAENGRINVTINATTTATQIRFGEGGPTSPTGVNGDFYIDKLTLNYYRKSAGAWSLQGVLKGTKGDDGDKGDPGTGVLEGAGPPNDAQGIDGDLYFNTEDGPGLGDIYKKVGGSWGSPIRNIKGAPGADGVDAIAPDLIAFSGGVDGQPEPLTYVMTVPCIQPFRLTEGLAGSAFWCRLDPTEDAQYLVYKGYAAGGAEQIGTFTYEANPGGGGGAGASVTFNDEIDFAIGDCLIVYSPPVTDATMAGASWTIKGVLLP